MPTLCGETMSSAHDPEIGIDFGKDHTPNQSSTASFALPKGRVGAAVQSPLLASRCYWMVSMELCDEPKSPSVRNDRLKPMFCDTSLVTVSRDSENVIK